MRPWPAGRPAAEFVSIATADAEMLNRLDPRPNDYCRRTSGQRRIQRRSRGRSVPQMGATTDIEYIDI